MKKRKFKIAIICKFVPQYRHHFFELLRARLEQANVELVLIYGQPGPKDASKKDAVDIRWTNKIENKIINVGSREIYWQPCLHLLKDADLVIVEQASKLLLNYVLQTLYLIGSRKLAFWGHGKNFQRHNASSLGELIKRYVSNKVHWWFAYNKTSAIIVRDNGFPEHRITIVQNAIDTKRLIEVKSNLDIAKLNRIKCAHGISGKNVCIFVGGMYPEKRLSFLLEACNLIKSEISDFEMLFIGAGPDAVLVKESMKQYDWIHYLGPIFDEEKVPYFMLSKLFLMPGLVGLCILDSFALDVPLVTTAGQDHSPEIEYLLNDINGVIVEDTENPLAYAEEVIRILRNENYRQKLILGCKAANKIYTVEEMVERFSNGVLEALKA